MSSELGEPAAALADAYVALGAKATFTCAPYLLDAPSFAEEHGGGVEQDDHRIPELGQHIGWGESNAVIFANSVLGARTQKYADYLDVCIALVGRAPAAGAHLDAERKPEIWLEVDLGAPTQVGTIMDAGTIMDDAGDNDDAGTIMDDAFWPVLGYLQR